MSEYDLSGLSDCALAELPLKEHSPAIWAGAGRYGEVPLAVALVDRAHRCFAKPARDPGGDQRESRSSYFTCRGHCAQM